MRDQSSQFVPNSGFHVAGENKICFQTIIFEGVNFIVNTSLFTSHVTMPIPTPTIPQTSSSVSTVNLTSSFTESMAEFEEDNVVPLGDYF